MKYKEVSTIGLAILGLTSVLSLVLYAIDSRAYANQHNTWIAALDIGDNDTKLGYILSNQFTELNPLHIDADIEGLACLNESVIAVKGHERQPSEVSSVYLGEISSVDHLAYITANGLPVYEAEAATTHDNTVYVWLNDRLVRGLHSLDVQSGIASSVYPSDYNVAAMEIVSDTLWFVAEDTKLFQMSMQIQIPQYVTMLNLGGKDVEAMGYLDGKLYMSAHGGSFSTFDLASYEIVHNVFDVPGNTHDIEALVWCSKTRPIATSTPMLTVTNTGTPTATNTLLPTMTPTSTPQVTSTSTVTPLPTMIPTIPSIDIEIVIPNPTNLDTEEQPALHLVYVPLIRK